MAGGDARSPIWPVFAIQFRSRFRSAVGLALLTGLAGGIVLAAAAGARRTDTAYSRFLAASHPSDVIVGSVGALHVDAAVIRGLPNVVDTAEEDYVFTNSGVTGSGSGPALFVGNPMIAADGRWLTTVDRAKVLAGRRPDPARPDEVAASYTAARDANLRVGSTIHLVGFAPEQYAAAISGQTNAPRGPAFTLRVVGIEAAPGELPPALPGDALHLTPAFGQQYRNGVAIGINVAVRLRHGPADVGGFERAVLQATGGVAPRFITRAANAPRVHRPMGLQAVALEFFAAVAALAGALIVGQALVRHLFIQSTDHPVLGGLGMTRRQLSMLSLLHGAVPAAAGGAVAVAIAYAASPLSPVGIAHQAEPHPGLAFNVAILGAGAAAIVMVGLVLSATLAWTPSVTGGRPPADSSVRPGRASAFAARLGLPPSAVTGVRLATEVGSGRTASPVRSTVFGAVVAIAAVVAAVGFVSSLDHLFRTPALYGWNWDVSVGNAHATDLASRLGPSLAHSPYVGAFSGASTAALSINGVVVASLGLDPVEGDVVPTMLAGSEPRQPYELAVGAKTLRLLHRRLGDTVVVSAGDRSQTMRIVGRAVLPGDPLGTGASDTGSLGEGALLTEQGLRMLIPGAAENQFFVRFSPAVAPPVAAAGLSHEVAFGQIRVVAAQRPVDLAAFDTVRRLPFALAGVLTVLAVATIVHALGSAVRRRGRDLAILKALGFVRSQVVATVLWQATTIAAIALVVGVPVGLAVGRWTWAVVANQIGIAFRPVVPLLAVALAVPATLVLVNLAAAIPGQLAAAVRPTAALRSE